MDDLTVQAVSRGSDGFDAFVSDFGLTLWQSLIPLVGPDRARDAAADGFSYAWRNWDRISVMDNPRGYVYVASKRIALERPHSAGPLPAPSALELPNFEPRLIGCLAELSEMQRSVVYLVEGCGWGLTDAASLLGISISTLRNHLARAIDRLRLCLHVDQPAERSERARQKGDPS